jgi:gas vesicle protein
MSRHNETGAILGSLFVGALAGAVAALLLAPQSGRETRNQLTSEAEKLKEEIEKYASDFSEKAKKAKADLEEKLRRTEAELRDVEDELGV